MFLVEVVEMSLFEYTMVSSNIIFRGRNYLNYVFLLFQLLENGFTWFRIHVDDTDCSNLRADLRVPYLDTQLLAEERSTLLGTENILWIY
jgi:hypothetical protein